LDETLEALAADFNLPFGVPGGMASYRRTLTLSFFFRFWHVVQQELGTAGLAESREALDDITSEIHRAVSQGSRDNSDPFAQEVVGKQEPHDSGLVHATGEARYLDDIPATRDELYAGLVLSDRPHAKVLSVDPSAALKMPGVHDFVSHKDIKGENHWGLSFGREEFFVTDTVFSEGQYIGLILADNKHQAQAAAAAVSIQYEDLPAILTIEQAIDADSYFKMDRMIQSGEPIDEALKKAAHVFEGSVRTGGQESVAEATTVLLTLH
jgi:xanthine dehydrogenase/oxidase